MQRPPILAFGDSLTFGIGGSGRSYPDVLSNAMNWPVRNSANLGEVSRDSVERFRRTLVQSKPLPRVIVLCIGTNDLLQGVPPEDLLSNIRQMLAMARSKRVNTLVLAVPAVGSGASHALFDQIEPSPGLIVDKLTLPRIARDPLFRADLVHLNAEGYQRLAEGVHDALKTADWVQ